MKGFLGDLDSCSEEEEKTATILPVAPPHKIDSTVLFSGQRRVIIVHQNEEYRLQITRQGKLILTK